MTKSKGLTVDEALMRLAYDMTFNKPIESFCVWWAKRYNKPLFHDSLNDYLEEELVMEWFVTRLLEDKKFKSQCEHGILNVEEMDEEWLKKEMGDAYKPPAWKDFNQEAKEIMDSIEENPEGFHDSFEKSST